MRPRPKRKTVISETDANDVLSGKMCYSLSERILTNTQEQVQEQVLGKFPDVVEVQRQTKLANEVLASSEVQDIRVERNKQIPEVAELNRQIRNLEDKRNAIQQEHNNKTDALITEKLKAAGITVWTANRRGSLIWVKTDKCPYPPD